MIVNDAMLHHYVREKRETFGTALVACAPRLTLSAAAVESVALREMSMLKHWVLQNQ